jgi:hypothetical protein
MISNFCIVAIGSPERMSRVQRSRHERDVEMTDEQRRKLHDSSAQTAAVAASAFVALFVLIFAMHLGSDSSALTVRADDAGYGYISWDSQQRSEHH